MKSLIYPLFFILSFSIVFSLEFNITNPEDNGLVHINTPLEWTVEGDFRYCYYQIDDGNANYNISAPHLKLVKKLYNLDDVSALYVWNNKLVVAGSQAIVAFEVSNLSNILTGDTQTENYRTDENPNRILCKGEFDCFFIWNGNSFLEAFEVAPYTEIDYLGGYPIGALGKDMISDGGGWLWITQPTIDRIIALDAGDAEEIILGGTYSGVGSPNYTDGVFGIDFYNYNIFYASNDDNAISSADVNSLIPEHLDSLVGNTYWLNGAIDVVADSVSKLLYVLSDINDSLGVFDFSDVSDLGHIVSMIDGNLEDSEQLFLYDDVLYVDDVFNTQILSYDVSDKSSAPYFIEVVDATNRTIDANTIESLRDFMVYDYILYNANEYYDEINIFSTRNHTNDYLYNLTPGEYHNVTITCKDLEGKIYNHTNVFYAFNYNITDLSYSPEPLYNGSTVLYVNFTTAFYGNTSIVVTNGSNTYTLYDEVFQQLHPFSLYIDYHIEDRINITVFSCDTWGICVNDTFKVPTIINYPPELNPIIGDICALESNCTVSDSYVTSTAGSWEDSGNNLLNQELENYSINYDYFDYHPSVDYIFTYSDYPYSNFAWNTYTWDINAEYSYDYLGLYYIEVCLNPSGTNVTSSADAICQYYEQEIQDTFWGDTGASGITTANANSSNECGYNLKYEESYLAPCQEERLTHFWFDVNDNSAVNAIGNLDGGVLTYTPNPDCIDDNCTINISRYSYASTTYCKKTEGLGYDNYTLEGINEATKEQDIDLWLCYINDAWNGCGCSISGYDFDDWVNNWNHDIDSCGTTILIEEPEYDSYGDVTCNPLWGDTALDDITYYKCDTRDIYDSETGKWCVKVKTFELDCKYNCVNLDFDNDGTNDCNDVCCGYNDSLDADFDAIPDACDPCIDSPVHVDNDGDGYYDCIGTCFDNIKNLDETDIDYGGVCGTCLDELLSPRINETDIDYGGKCGYCVDAPLLKITDPLWLIIPNKEFPFDFNDCGEIKASLGVVGAIIIVLIILLSVVIFIVFFILILPQIALGATIFKLIADFFRTSKSRKKRKL